MRNRQRSWGKLGKEHLLLHWETFITIHRWNRGSPSLATLPKITPVSGGFSVKTEIRLVQWPIHHPNKMFEFLRDRATFQCLLFLHLVVLTLGQCHPPSGHLEKSGSTFGTPVKGVGCASGFQFSRGQTCCNAEDPSTPQSITYPKMQIVSCWTLYAQWSSWGRSGEINSLWHRVSVRVAVTHQKGNVGRLVSSVG